MRSFALVLIAGLAAATPQYGYGDKGDYGYGDHPEPSSTYEAVKPSSTPAAPSTVEHPGYPVYTPPTEYKPSSSVKVEIKSSSKPAQSHAVPISSVVKPDAPKSTYDAGKPPPVVTKVDDTPSESPCPSSTVTVTVTLPPGANVPTGNPPPPHVPSGKGPNPGPSPSSGPNPPSGPNPGPGPNPTPYYPTGGVPTKVYQPTGTGVPTGKPTPPAFTGAASTANAGLFVAGVGAFAAFFL